MKVVQLCMAFWLVGAVFSSLNCVKDGPHHSILVSGRKMADGSAMAETRNPKEKMDDHGSSRGEVSLEDYSSPSDSSPSSKASIKHGPIEHGAPLMPYIPNPKPSPPPHPSSDDNDDDDDDGSS